MLLVMDQGDVEVLWIVTKLLVMDQGNVKVP